MSTGIEQRLTDALAARAELVRAEQLTDRGVPAPAPRRPGRTWLVVTGVAAACAAAIALTFVLLGHDRTAAPALPDTPHRLTGDVDGDGKPDTVTLARTGAVTLRLGSGPVLRGEVRTPAELVGLADVGRATKGIVVAEHPTGADVDALQLGAEARDAARVATVLTIGDGLLDRARPAHDLVPFARTRTSTFWVADGKLLETEWVGRRPARSAVGVGRITLTGDGLEVASTSELCWDSAIEPYPSSCRPGHDFRVDVGVRGPLPALFPEASAYVDAGHPMTATIGGRSVDASLSRSDRAGHAVLQVRVDGKTYRATTPAESPNGSIFTRLVPDRTDPRGFGVALRFECCDYAHVDVFTLRAGRLELAPVAKDALFGDGFAAGRTRAYRTWQGPTGALFTADRAQQDGARLHVLADELVDGRLEQRTLGWVCTDPADPARWGRCPD